ncbi:MAG: hypothetical protein FWC32_13100 [Firmicutes bacterium]|nr:hypothetical protein [Bacillota bacterium]
MRNDKALNIMIPKQLHDELQQLADRKYLSLASLVRLFCAEGLEREINKAISPETAHEQPQFKMTAEEWFNKLPSVSK